METAPNAARTVALTCAAMVAFAANSVLCRQALGSRSIDAATFSAVRLLSGAAILFAVVSLRRSRRSVMIGGRWTSAVVMFLYAIPFSFAFNSLDAGTGALILFGSVQVTMILAALWSGERPRLLEWVGLCTAAGGLLYLYFDGLETPSLRGAGLMSLAGVCWGLYTLLGRSARQPLAETAGNFIRTAPLALVLVMLAPGFVSMRGMVLAVACGAITSGLGYAVWYAALKGLTATRAATVQLAIPLLAAAGGLMILREPISRELVISAGLILGGIGLAIAVRANVAAQHPPNGPRET